MVGAQPTNLPCPTCTYPIFALILTLREWELDSRGVVAGVTTIAAATTTTSLAGAVAYQKASQSNAASLPIYHPPGTLLASYCRVA
jgi:hypothetical protein